MITIKDYTRTTVLRLLLNMMINMMIWLIMRKDLCFRIIIRKNKTHRMVVVEKSMIVRWRNCIWLRVIVMWREHVE